MMYDQYFGHKELYEVVLRAKTPMQFGDRRVEAQEPVLYFNNVNMSLLSEQNRPVFARGGWANMPRVIWDERSEVQFQMVEGVMSSTGMSILLGANVISEQQRADPIYVPMKEDFNRDNLKEVIKEWDEEIVEDGETKTVHIKKSFPCAELKHLPVFYPEKKTFIFYADRNAIQGKVYGEYKPEVDPFGVTHYCVLLTLNKENTEPAEINRKYTIDYYYKYEEKALIYSVKKERFNGLFTLEAKFYSKDENDGLNYTNVLFMPKVRVVSNINLRLGERADPTVSTFNIIGLPETVGEQKNLIMEITRLNQNDADDI